MKIALNGAIVIPTENELKELNSLIMGTSKGREKYIESPEKLWQLFEEFVEHEKNSPFYKREYVGRDGREVDTALQVPITFEAFEVWLADKNIIQELGNYSSNMDGKYTEYLPIISRIKKFCYAQNLKGASVGVFNHNIIARKLGLTDKTESQQNITGN